MNCIFAKVNLLSAKVDLRTSKVNLLYAGVDLRMPKVNLLYAGVDLRTPKMHPLPIIIYLNSFKEQFLFRNL